MFSLLRLSASTGELKATGEATQITFENRGARRPAWVDEHDIVFSDHGVLSRVSTSGNIGPKNKSQQLASFGGNITELAISRHGHRLTYGRRLFHSSIWRSAVALRKKPQPDGGSASFISSTRNDLAPQYSRDGKRITFISARSGNSEVWTCDSDGSNALQLTSFGGPDVTTPRWSPDGTLITFDSTAGGQYDIWVVDANGGKPKRMTTNPANDGNPSWSHDGQWIYFDSARTGEAQIWKIPANGGEAIQLTHDGGFGALESPDGKVLY